MQEGTVQRKPADAAKYIADKVGLGAQEVLEWWNAEWKFWALIEGDKPDWKDWGKALGGSNATL
jgi:hypothetical protein